MMARFPAVGDKLPPATLTAPDGSALDLAEYAGRKLVLFFYPKDDTSGCTAEACAFRDALPDFTGIQADVIGISRDSVASHDKFKTKFKLPFPLASDADGKVFYYYYPARRHTINSEFDVRGLDALPRVDIVLSYVGADGAMVEAAAMSKGTASGSLYSDPKGMTRSVLYAPDGLPV